VSVLFLFALGLAFVAVVAGWTLLGVRKSRKRGASRYFILPVVAVLLSVPLSLLLTLFLVPFWRWLESTHGIESIGHSGPAGWCYLAVFLTCVVILGSAGLLIAQRRQHP
jgi:hypothetical protein